jgi:hypothetical protein
LLLRFAGSFLLRLAARQFLALLFQEPPRRTPLRPCSTNLFGRTRPPGTTKIDFFSKAAFGGMDEDRRENNKTDKQKTVTQSRQQITRKPQ